MERVRRLTPVAFRGISVILEHACARFNSFELIVSLARRAARQVDFEPDLVVLDGERDRAPSGHTRGPRFRLRRSERLVCRCAGNQFCDKRADSGRTHKQDVTKPRRTSSPSLKALDDDRAAVDALVLHHPIESTPPEGIRTDDADDDRRARRQKTPAEATQRTWRSCRDRRP